MNSKEVMKAAIVATIAISAAIVLLGILSFQAARAQILPESSYAITSKSIQGKWVGLKYIAYNFPQQDGKTAVRLQSWIDQNNDGSWVKINDFVDSGRWGDQGGYCGGTPDQLITWGGPIATFRWDYATNVDFKNFSVREIQALMQ